MWGRLLIGVLGGLVGGVAVWLALEQDRENPPAAPIPGKTSEQSVHLPTSAPPSVSSLAEISGNAIDFQRHTELHALLADTSLGAVKALLAETETLAPTPHRYDVARVLYTRFAELDPAAATDHVLAAVYHSSWVASVFRAWAHTDLDAAVDRAATLEDDAKAIAAAAILELDLPEWQQRDVAKQLDGEVALVAIAVREALGGADKNFAKAWQSALLAVDIPQAPRSFGEAGAFVGALRQLTLLVRRWASDDPAAAMAAVVDAGNEQIAMTAKAAVLQVWAADDPSAAIAWLSEQQDGPVPNGIWLSQVLMRGLMEQQGVNAAIRALDTIPAHLQERARSGLVTALQFRDSSDTDFQMVLDWYGSLESPSHQLTFGLAGAYAAHDPEQALAWATRTDGLARGPALAIAVGQLVHSDPALAKRLIAEIEAPQVRMDAAREFVNRMAENDPRGTLQWARSFSVEEDRRQLERGALAAWSLHSPREAVREVLASPDAELRDDVAGDIAWIITEKGQPELVEELFDVVAAESVRIQIARALLRHYTDIDPDENKAALYRGIVDGP